MTAKPSRNPLSACAQENAEQDTKQNISEENRLNWLLQKIRQTIVLYYTLLVGPIFVLANFAAFLDIKKQRELRARNRRKHKKYDADSLG